MSSVSCTNQSVSAGMNEKEIFIPAADHNQAAKLQRKDESNVLETTLCFLCRDKSELEVDPACKVCQNIRAYLAKNELVSTAEKKNKLEDDNVDVTFPGPGVVRRNHIYGNYVVASRCIEAGEIIIREKPLNIGPYGTSDVLPLCLSCGKDVGLSSKCSTCKWPVCGPKCEKFYLHAENECPIFAKNGLRTKGVLNEYFGVEALRTLLLRSKNPYAWKRILEMEPHIEARTNDLRALLTTKYIADFIQKKCNLADEFSYDLIEHVVGVLSVNTFWAFKDLHLYASCMFDKISLFAHDCDPNTERQLIYIDEKDSNENVAQGISSIALQIKASRRIEAEEMITIRYIDINQPVMQRRQELKDTFYFDCTCTRCLTELSASSKVTPTK